MARIVAHPASVAAIQTSVPAALTRPWPETDAEIQDSICEWAHAVVIGPGLGLEQGTRARLERILELWRGPVVLDADALTLFEGDVPALAALLDGRRALITPHVVEFARLSGATPDDVARNAFDAGRELAAQLRCIVLLKGVPTVITSPSGHSLISAAGTPTLASGGSGDALAGVAATLVAQMDDPFEASACAAWIHGRAGELAGAAGVRGSTIADVVDSLAHAWNEPLPPRRPPILTELAAIRTPRPVGQSSTIKP
jgi:NAD(P)H-hydrate epimerase